MRGWIVSGAVAACLAACAGRATAPEPLVRPRAAANGLTAAEEAARNRHMLLLEGLGRFGAHMDPRQPAGATPSLVAPVMPPAPVVLPLVRPRLRDDALVLADVALARGDALDAAAQYRALLARRDRAIAGYVNVRLASAYLAMGDVRRADAALRDAVRSPDAAWYAVVQLALLRLRTQSPSVVLGELSTLLPSRVGDLENLLVHVTLVADPAGAAEVLAAKAARDVSDPRACGYVLAAIARGHAGRAPYIDARCAPEVERAYAMAYRHTWLDPRNPSRRLLGENLETWHAATATKDPGAWLAIAERAVEAMEVAQTDDDTRLASITAATALTNVLRLWFDGILVDEAQLDRFRDLVDALPARHRGTLRALASRDRLVRDRVFPGAERRERAEVPAQPGTP